MAEDDDDMRAVVAHALATLGFRVEEVSDGATLSDWARKGWDLIISDVRLPKRTGLAAIQELRSAGVSTPVIFMTAFCDDTVRSHSASLGAVLLDKPFEVAELLLAVRRLVCSA